MHKTTVIRCLLVGCLRIATPSKDSELPRHDEGLLVKAFGASFRPHVRALHAHPPRLARARNHGDLPENTALAARTLPAGWGFTLKSCSPGTAAQNERPCRSRISALAKALERRIWANVS